MKLESVNPLTCEEVELHEPLRSPDMFGGEDTLLYFSRLTSSLSGWPQDEA